MTRRSLFPEQKQEPPAPARTLASIRTPLATSPSQAPPRLFAQVATLGAAPGTWTYAVPPEFEAELSPGRRVLVPFGTRRRAGIVISCSPTPPTDEFKIREIEQLLDDGPLLTPEVLRLITWSSNYYAAPLGLGLRAALPPGAEVEEKLSPQLTEAGRQALHAPGTPSSLRKPLAQLIHDQKAALKPAQLRALVKAGFVQLQSEVRAKAAPPMIDLVLRVADKETKIPEHHTIQQAVWALLQTQEQVALELISSQIPGSRDAVRRMARKGLVEIQSVPRERAAPEVFGQVQEPPALTADQAKALDVLLSALSQANRLRELESEAHSEGAPRKASGSVNAKGSPGSSGASGAAGSFRSTGAIGSPGPTGSTEAKGSPGASGRTPTGSTEAKGSPGASGTTGSSDLTGSIGSSGSAGSTGSIRSTSSTGSSDFPDSSASSSAPHSKDSPSPQEGKAAGQATERPELPPPFLLHGVTGSGKTEVYLKLIAEVRKRGDSALVLVPEIALTPQLAGRFRARFGNEVAVLHSGLKERDRLAEWHRVRRGDAPIVVGARSAVFAPVANLGAIIVDEEHDGSFKQEQGLRYNGRDLAVIRSRFAQAIIVLGSATPSLESLHNADTGRYQRLRLPTRVDNSRPMPLVELVDLRERKIEKSSETIAPSHLLSPRLVSALQETVEKGEQAIVFLNRRGHSTVVLCRDCGHSLSCQHCSVAMTWHERSRRLTCHYCNQHRRVPDLCENCQGGRLLYAGAGTEKLEEELAEALPKARIGRLDRDTAATSARLERLLVQFSQGELDVLVGTQMVAKGHDFPKVTLVCVLLADSGLNQPDFRAAERTAQLLTQVAGRAGRGERPGRVLVQSFNPDSPAIAATSEHDYEGFARSELPEREALFYPPFSRLCLIRIDGERESEARVIAAQLCRHIRDANIPELQVLGPAPSPLERLRGRYRFQLLLKAPRPSTLGLALRAMNAASNQVPSAVRVVVDVDPVDML